MPAKRVSKLPASNLVPREDWDFSKVPEQELEACCLWEYARESEFLRELKLRCAPSQMAAVDPATNHLRLHEDLMRVQSLGPAALVFLGGFFKESIHPTDPQSPSSQAVGRSFPTSWQLLGDRDKSLRVEQRESKIPRDWLPAFGRTRWTNAIKMLTDHNRETAGLGSLPAEANTEPNGSIFMAGSEIGVFEIGWAHYTNEQLRDRFVQWIGLNRPPDFPAPSRQGKRKHDRRVALKRLGIMRLMHHLPLPEVPKAYPDAWKALRRLDWRRERRRAGEEFRRLLPILPEGEFPRSWATASQ